MKSCDLDEATEGLLMRRMNCDVGEMTEGLENEQSLLLQPLLLLHLRHSSFSNLSVASLMSQLIL